MTTIREPRRVRFAEETVASIHVYPGMNLGTLSDMFYQVDDYTRFRIERAEEEIEKEKAAFRMSLIEAKARRIPHSRRDSLTMVKKSAPYKHHPEGVALAA